MPTRTMLAIALVLLVSLAGCSKRFVKLSENEVNQADKAQATEVGNTLLHKLQASQFYPLGEEVSPKMRQTFTPGEQAAAWAAIVQRYGEFQHMVYAQTWGSRDGRDTRIYRFRGTFGKGQPEVRVVINAQGQLDGLWIKDWKEGVE